MGVFIYSLEEDCRERSVNIMRVDVEVFEWLWLISF